MPLAIGFVAGIALDAVVAVPVAVAVALFAAGAAAFSVSAERVTLRFVVLGLAAMGPGALLHHASDRRVAADHLAGHVGAESRFARVTATVLAPPVVTYPVMGGFEHWMRFEPRTRFVAEARDVTGPAGPVRASGRFLVFVRQAHLAVDVGDTVELSGRLFRLRPTQNPGAFDWTRHQRRRGIVVGMTIKHTAAVRTLARGDPPRWRRMLTGVRRWTTRALFDNVTPDESGSDTLLAAMILGQRSGVDRAINDAFLRTGAAHFLAVSGVHVGILALFVWTVCRVLGLSHRAGALTVAVAVITYALITEPRPSVIRATILVTFAMVAVFLRRPSNYGNFIALAAIVILVCRPTDLFDVGCQLSFACTLAVMYLHPRLLSVVQIVLRRPDDDVLKLVVPPAQWWPARLPRITGSIVAAFTTTLAAWLVATPLVVLYFGRFSPLGWINSVVLLPFVMLVMVFGFAKLLLALVFPLSSAFTGPVLAGLVGVLAYGSQWLARVPGVSIEVDAPPLWWIALYYVALGAWMLRPALGLSWKVPTGFAVAAAALAALSFVPEPRTRPALDVHVLSVGNGSATVIELPDGRTWLYDAGSVGAYDVGASVVVPFLRHRGVQHVDAAVVSHPNVDHYSGTLSIRDAVDVNEWFFAPHFERLSEARSPSRHLLIALGWGKAAIRKVAADQTLPAGPGVRVDVLWPPAGAKSLSTNDSSLVLRIEHAGRRVLLCGDIEEAPQEALIKRGGIDADVLVLPHHGDVERTTEAFIEAVGPRFLVRSSGQRYAQTPKELLDLIKDRTYYNTADDGAIAIRLGAESVTVTPFRPRDGREGVKDKG